MGYPKDRLLDPEGTTLVEVQLRRLSPHFPNLMLLGAPVSGPSLYGERSLADPEPFHGCGPLAGLLTGLRHSRSDWLALLPIDCPFFPAQAFLQAVDRAEPGDRALGFLQQQSGKEQWLPGLYHRALIPKVEKALKAEQLSLKRLVDSVSHRFLPWCAAHEDGGGPICEERAFSNLNTPEQAALLGFNLPPQKRLAEHLTNRNNQNLS